MIVRRMNIKLAPLRIVAGIVICVLGLGRKVVVNLVQHGVVSCALRLMATLWHDVWMVMVAHGIMNIGDQIPEIHHYPSPGMDD